MGGKKGAASAKHKRNKKQVKKIHCGGPVLQSSKHTPSYGHFVSLEDELVPLGLSIRTVSSDAVLQL